MSFYCKTLGLSIKQAHPFLRSQRVEPLATEEKDEQGWSFNVQLGCDGIVQTLKMAHSVE
jgi:hypothetical protein